jgi:hypothetical protein
VLSSSICGLNRFQVACVRLLGVRNKARFAVTINVIQGVPSVSSWLILFFLSFSLTHSLTQVLQPSAGYGLLVHEVS